MSSVTELDNILAALPPKDRREADRRIKAAKKKGWESIWFWCDEEGAKIGDLAGINPNTSQVAFLDACGFDKDPDTFQLFPKEQREQIRRALYNEIRAAIKRQNPGIDIG